MNKHILLSVIKPAASKRAIVAISMTGHKHVVQLILSVTTTYMIKCITCDLFTNVF